MREIKFRAWSMSEKLMILPRIGREDYLDISLNGSVYDCQIEPSEKTNDYIIMQYTGLKDKNGVEIYEGDILENGGVVEYQIPCDEEYGTIGWFGIEYPWTSKHDTVIGNIYENPELLEKNK